MHHHFAHFLQLFSRQITPVVQEFFWIHRRLLCIWLISVLSFFVGLFSFALDLDVFHVGIFLLAWSLHGCTHKEPQRCAIFLIFSNKCGSVSALGFGQDSQNFFAFFFIICAPWPQLRARIIMLGGASALVRARLKRQNQARIEEVHFFHRVPSDTRRKLEKLRALEGIEDEIRTKSESFFPLKALGYWTEPDSLALLPGDFVNKKLVVSVIDDLLPLDPALSPDADPLLFFQEEPQVPRNFKSAVALWRHMFELALGSAPPAQIASDTVESLALILDSAQRTIHERPRSWNGSDLRFTEIRQDQKRALYEMFEESPALSSHAQAAFFALAVRERNSKEPVILASHSDSRPCRNCARPVDCILLHARCCMMRDHNDPVASSVLSVLNLKRCTCQENSPPYCSMCMMQQSANETIALLSRCEYIERAMLCVTRCYACQGVYCPRSVLKICVPSSEFQDEVLQTGSVAEALPPPLPRLPQTPIKQERKKRGGDSTPTRTPLNKAPKLTDQRMASQCFVMNLTDPSSGVMALTVRPASAPRKNQKGGSGASLVRVKTEPK